jgi:lipopolysaccharide/colanic/teichoic acid biosynthesis glycosyltransferase
LALVALVVKISSRGPVLYGDWREGKAGTPFRCWKFRTMGVGANSEQRKLLQKNQVDGPQFKLQNDPRVTRVGRWLRTTNLDELPQLFNVVRGEMSLVGPRPSPFRENQLCVPWRERRLSVPPGITGLWQICRQRRGSGDFHQWIYYDMLYVSNLSAWLDLKILVFTVLSLGGKWGVPLARVIPPQPLADDE